MIKVEAMKATMAKDEASYRRPRRRPRRAEGREDESGEDGIAQAEEASTTFARRDEARTTAERYKQRGLNLPPPMRRPGRCRR